MEILDDDTPLILGGIKQRATLGYLLLHANKVVATSQLLNALWGIDDAPATARKILQNAVYGLRGLLSSRRSEPPGADAPQGGTMLLTQPPGYVLRVDPEQLDLHRFHTWVSHGRARQAQGAPEAAATLLRDALNLWRGPALADLVEAGIEWPDLVALQNTRLDVMEDYFDAQLACGRHHAVLTELQMMVQAEPLRERSCGQLMLALYRCGRQADALSLYGRVRSVLVEDLGLEPGHGLQSLQQAILTQDPALTPGRPGTGVPTAGDHARENIRLSAPTRSDEVGGTGAQPETPQRADAPEAEQRAADAARHRVGVLSIRTRLAPSPDRRHQHDVDELLDGTTLVVREEIERFGGTVTASIGSVTLALFGLQGAGDDDAHRAVLAALAIRDVIGECAEAGAAHLTVHASVTMGEILLRHHTQAAAATVVGTVLDESQALLRDVPPGEVRVSDDVRRATEHAVSYRGGGASFRGWQVLEVHQGHGGRDAEASEPAYELDVLRGLAKRTWHRSVPHLVTVLGDSGTGRTRLVERFGGWLAEQPAGAVLLTGRTPAAPDDSPLKAHAEILAAYCGVGIGAGPAEAHAAMAREVQSLFPSGQRAAWVLSRLGTLVDVFALPGTGMGGDATPQGEALEAWREFFQEAARRRPVVLCIDDLHRAEENVLDAVEELAGSTRLVPLFVVATAGPELLLRRPGWSGGKSHVTTVTLEGSETAHERLVELLLSSARDVPSHSLRG
ncbi:BTAD domain-containing putative transcriptional regulator [Streptomyces spinoverrucosus]|uniref:BTAD domain-containing putative transcriptional regulator n=1 Tax=Streptomyces spinoverrucosus TaxID=284043 RepID=UPI001E61AC7C|nr:BTAD domain-containing putative transcriptional regulator [Streptomyces spinoverrucosus]